MKKRILVLLTVTALMIVMLAFAVATAFAQGEQREHRGVACDHAGFEHVPFCEVTM